MVLRVGNVGNALLSLSLSASSGVRDCCFEGIPETRIAASGVDIADNASPNRLAIFIAIPQRFSVWPKCGAVSGARQMAHMGDQDIYIVRFGQETR